jgi:hypothetical protein
MGIKIPKGGMNMMGVWYRILSDSSKKLLFMACDAPDVMCY